VKLDDVLESLETKYPDKLKGLLPRIYAGSNLDAVSVRGLINLFSKDIFEADHGGDDLIGRVYEYFIGEFASSEGKRGGEYFTPVSIVKTLVAMLEPEKGVVFDPCCGSGGMFVQSDLFTKHSHQLSFVGQESKDFTYRLCRMNLFIHGLDANIQLGNSYFDDKHATLKADYVLANPPFNDGSKGENGWGADRIGDKGPRLTLGGFNVQRSRCGCRRSSSCSLGTCTTCQTLFSPLRWRRSIDRSFSKSMTSVLARRARRFTQGSTSRQPDSQHPRR
jgi:type I restriction enzyme M protein